MELAPPSGPIVDRGTWRIDLAPPVYRLWSSVHNAHFYTIARDEANALTDRANGGWAHEGIAFCAYPEGPQPVAARPVYRLRSHATGKHLYTMQELERARLVTDPTGGWADEGVAFYAYPENDRPPQTKPVHRFWARIAGGHLYTMNEAERDKLITRYANAWAYEGIAWYALPRPD
jgi:hypothetical protein